MECRSGASYTFYHLCYARIAGLSMSAKSLLVLFLISTLKEVPVRTLHWKGSEHREVSTVFITFMSQAVLIFGELCSTRINHNFLL